MQPLAPLAVFAVAAAVSAQSDWPQYQGGPHHSGFLPVTLDPTTFVPRYDRLVATTGAYALEPVTVADGKVFVTATDKVLRVLDAATGNQLWQLAFPTANSVNPPSFDGGRVYVQTGNHGNDTYLRCYDADTGALVFQSNHAAQWERYHAPTLRDGAVWINGGYYGGMYCFDAQNGQQRWFVALPQYDEWTPAVDGDTAYAYVGGALYALDRQTGAERFRVIDPGFSWMGWSMDLAPVLGGQDDLLVVHGGRLVRFDILLRNLAWTVPGTFAGQPAVHDGTVFAINANSLQARDQATGALLWSWAEPGETLRGNVIATNGHVIVSSAQRTFVVDRTTHDDVYTIQAAGHLTIGEGALFVARSNGSLTSVGFATLPTALGVQPRQADYHATPPAVTVTGTGFLAGTGLTVEFGGQAATQVTVIDDQTLTCVPPARGPGVVAVTLENSNGRTTRERAFAYTPAVDHVGDTFPGQVPTVSFHQPQGRQLIAAWGIGPRVSMQFPPLLGAMEIWPNHTLFFAPHWITDRLDLPLPIPANPALTGVSLLFQSLVGSNLFYGGQGAFANCHELIVQ